jgi:alpha-glucosidase
VKESGIIPMQGVIQNTTEKPSPVMELHIYQGDETNSFAYFEDDGETYNYENGGFYKRLITYDPLTRSIRFSKTEGAFPSKFSSVNLVLHDFGNMNRIKINGQEFEMKLTTGKERVIEFPLKDEMIEIQY